MFLASVAALAVRVVAVAVTFVMAAAVSFMVMATAFFGPVPTIALNVSFGAEPWITVRSIDRRRGVTRDVVGHGVLVMARGRR